jgi:hypothetical protein
MNVVIKETSLKNGNIMAESIGVFIILVPWPSNTKLYKCCKTNDENARLLRQLKLRLKKIKMTLWLNQRAFSLYQCPSPETYSFKSVVKQQ